MDLLNDIRLELVKLEREVEKDMIGDIWLEKNKEGKLIKGVLKGTLEANELNSSQKSVAEKILNYSVSFIWGPPGTGKTQTLGAALTCFYDWKYHMQIWMSKF